MIATNDCSHNLTIAKMTSVAKKIDRYITVDLRTAETRWEIAEVLNLPDFISLLPNTLNLFTCSG